MTLHPMQERVPTGPAIAAGLFIGILASLTVGAILLEVLPPSGWYLDHPFDASISWLIQMALSNAELTWRSSPGTGLVSRMLTIPNQVWTDCIVNYDLAISLCERILAILITGFLAGIFAAIKYKSVSTPVDELNHLMGSRLWRGFTAIKILRLTLAEAIRAFGRGIYLAPGVVVSRATEVQHFGLFGTSGSGKTIILRYLLEQILRWTKSRGDKLVIHDSKGDMVSGLPVDTFALLAPVDSRSYAWDIAPDFPTKQSARELAACLIHESRDPTWSSAARDVLTGIIIFLQRSKRNVWTWQDLADAVFLPAAELKSILADAYPPAETYIVITDENTPTKTTHSILISLYADTVSIVMPLADAWGAKHHSRRISLTNWVTNQSVEFPRTLVLQRSSQFPELSSAWIGAAVNCLASIAASPALPDSDTRRIWLVLDEFAQLGKLNGFLQLLEVGRAKGIACILALQDMQQLVAHYGEPIADTILTLLSTKIICKMPAGPSAKRITSNVIGNREVSYQEETVTWSDGKSSRTMQTQRATVPVVTQHLLESQLSAGPRGVKALVLGFGDVYELRWPFLIWPARRPGTKLAKWVNQ